MWLLVGVIVKKYVLIMNMKYAEITNGEIVRKEYEDTNIV